MVRNDPQWQEPKTIVSTRPPPPQCQEHQHLFSQRHQSARPLTPSCYTVQPCMRPRDISMCLHPPEPERAICTHRARLAQVHDATAISVPVWLLPGKPGRRGGSPEHIPLQTMDALTSEAGRQACRCEWVCSGRRSPDDDDAYLRPRPCSAPRPRHKACPRPTPPHRSPHRLPHRLLHRLPHRSPRPASTVSCILCTCT